MAVVTVSKCKFPKLTLPQIPDLIALLLALLKLFGITLPTLPQIPAFFFPCPLDAYQPG